LRTNFSTTLEKELIDKLKIEAIKEGKNVNDILELLISKYINGEILSEKVTKTPYVEICGEAQKTPFVTNTQKEAYKCVRRYTNE
jgi:hypothetical protein